MKSVSTALAQHLSGPVTTLACLWRLTRRDGTVLGFTDHDQDVVVDGFTYLASAGYDRSTIASSAGLAVDNLEIQGIIDHDLIREQDLRAGLWDHAEVEVFLVNWADPSQGLVRLRRGRLGEVVATTGGLFRVELRGLTQALSQTIGEVYTATCRADLGDARCRLPLWPPEIARSTAYAIGTVLRVPTATGPGAAAYENRVYRVVTPGTTAAEQPLYDSTPGAQTVDGTAVLVAEQAWTRAGEVTTVTDRRTFAVTITEPRATDGWFAGGGLTWESGANAGRTCEVKTWTQAGSLVELYLPVGYPVAPGDRFRIHPGCDKRLATCRDRFANILNFRGEPYVPGSDALMSYPDAR
ncbi:MAG: DUF2163 domain-containing protein [Rhodospirillaceae bacterium]|nr:DUF2163 domain-containing protein [Rhodospirillaceae bacterium]